MPIGKRRALIEKGHPLVSVRRQAELVGVNRAGLYYEPKAREDKLTDIVDEVYTECPFYGSRKIALVVSERIDRAVNRKHVQRIMREMGIQAIGPSPRLSKPAPGHKVYPYLLRGYRIKNPNEVWSTDITYVRLDRGFAFLTAIIDC